MSEAEGGIQPGAGAENLNLLHPSFQGLHAVVENVIPGFDDPTLRTQLQTAFQAFPEKYRPSLNGEIPHLPTSVISDSESAQIERVN